MSDEQGKATQVVGVSGEKLASMETALHVLIKQFDAKDVRDEKLAKDVHILTVKVEGYSTVVRRHIGGQETINERMSNSYEKMESRLRKIENFRARHEEAVPKRIGDCEAGIKAANDSIGAINKTLAKWAGVAVAGMIVANLAIPPLVRQVFEMIFGA